ncbi:MAG TPA: hypothetical protein DIU15_18255 [Deltaproteobacteria bacterium]|nr:hypothetical protein [Deltaproteobacteria bacterium]
MNTANLSPAHLVQQAWKIFTERPGLCIATWLVFAILGGSGGGGGGGAGSNNGALGQLEGVGALIVGSLFGLGVLLALAALLIAGPIRGGYELAMLRLIRRDPTVQFGDIFNGFSKFVSLTLTCLLMVGIVLLGILLCVLPGLMALLTLWPAYLLVMEDDLGPVEAIRGAWTLTKGHRLDLAVIAVVTLVLVALGTLACCIGLLVTGPITQLVWIGAYHEMRTAAGAYQTPEVPAENNMQLPEPTPGT